MQPDIPLLQQTILFSGIEAEELQHLLTELGVPFEVDTGIVRGLDY